MEWRLTLPICKHLRGSKTKSRLGKSENNMIVSGVEVSEERLTATHVAPQHYRRRGFQLQAVGTDGTFGRSCDWLAPAGSFCFPSRSVPVSWVRVQPRCHSRNSDEVLQMYKCRFSNPHVFATCWFVGEGGVCM